MLSKFTVLACYCIYFSKSKSEFAHMFFNVAGAHKTNKDTNEQISEAAKIALELMNPNWKLKAGKIKPDNKRDRRTLKQLRVDLRQAEDDYKNAEWSGGQLHMEICKNKIEQLRKQIDELVQSMGR